MQMKEYEEDRGYVRETILIFTDPDLEVENYQKVMDLLYGYTGNNGEVIDIKIFENEKGPGAIIWMVIICFKSLLRLLKVKDESYSRFIEKHKNDFQKYYKINYSDYGFD
ncbi:hypothetical protein [Methanobacterium formicicum]|uniref:Uncharacterized protein n=1 Tax=Methanobacterium formicicum TaxID=2162 RepID=A0A843ATH7_METFO|nr:hypothetical protein [Methanobacterium formicicum]MBF4474544.1 hypothetical protein [Methanobacterium formicicum]